MAVLAKYAGHAGHVRQSSADVRQRALTLPDILSSRIQYLPVINWEKCLAWGSKCPTEHWRPAGQNVRQTWNNFREDCKYFLYSINWNYLSWKENILPGNFLANLRTQWAHWKNCFICASHISTGFDWGVRNGSSGCWKNIRNELVLWNKYLTFHVILRAESLVSRIEFILRGVGRVVNWERNTCIDKPLVDKSK